MHIIFHLFYAYERNTLLQFQEFTLKIKELLISSQAKQQCFEGPETRVYETLKDVENIIEKLMKLHERLGEIKRGFIEKYTLDIFS